MEFTRKRYLNLKRLYEDAIKNNKPQFKFYGHELLTSYAKYLLEYLKFKFDDNRNNS